MAYAFGTPVDVVAAAHTKWCIVYDIAKREIWCGTARSKPANHISFHKLDFSREGPVLMLDVNAALEGDVEKSFTPHDRDVNLKVFRTLCARYGIEIPEEDALGIMQHIEGFKSTD